jgi:hypothetical protein
LVPVLLPPLPLVVGAATFTINEQLAFCCVASVAIAVTVVIPTGKTEPLAGEEETEIGAVPPLTVGAGYETAMPDDEVAVTF